MLINKVYNFCNETSLAIMFKFIEEGITSIEVSLNNEDWESISFNNGESDVKIWEELEPFSMVEIHYRYVKDDVVFKESFTTPLNIEEYTPTDHVDYSIPVDFRDKNKSGAL